MSSASPHVLSPSPLSARMSHPQYLEIAREIGQHDEQLPDSDLGRLRERYGEEQRLRTPGLPQMAPRGGSNQGSPRSSRRMVFPAASTDERERELAQ